MSDDWKTFLIPSGITHEVNGHNLVFYPITLAMTTKLKQIGGDLAEALTTIFTSNQNDVTQVVSQDETVISAIDPKLAEMRSNEKARAMRKAVETLLDSKNAEVVGAVLIDSLRDMFPDRKKAPPPAEFIAHLSLPHLGEMVVGLLKANAGVLGPLEGRAREAGAALTRAFEEHAGGALSPKTPGA